MADDPRPILWRKGDPKSGRPIRLRVIRHGQQIVLTFANTDAPAGSILNIPRDMLHGATLTISDDQSATTIDDGGLANER